MVLLNASKRSREAVRSSININQGGGSKKAGFPYQIGRESWSSMFMTLCKPGVENAPVCTLESLQVPKDLKMIYVRPTGFRPGRAYGRYSKMF